LKMEEGRGEREEERGKREDGRGKEESGERRAERREERGAFSATGWRAAEVRGGVEWGGRGPPVSVERATDSVALSESIRTAGRAA
jgi:hypothetical protein